MTITTQSTIRLYAVDREAIELHFLRLEREDRRLRFGSGVSDQALREYVARMDFERDGLFAVQDDELKLIAVVHVACARGAAELGLSVLPEWRGKGLGNALFTRALVFLRNRGATSVFVHCLSENATIMHLARKNGMRIVYSGGESEARLELAPATAESFMSEWLEDQRARAVQTFRQNGRLARLFFRPLATKAL